MGLSARRKLILACFALLSTAPAAHAQRVPAVPGISVSFSLRYEYDTKPGTTKITATAVIPQTLPGKQKVLSIKYSHEPEEVFDRDGNRYARFVLDSPGKEVEITVDVEAELYRRDLTVAVQKRDAPKENKEDLEPWLADEKYLEKDAPEIQKVAKQLKGANDVATVRNVMRFVVQTLRPGPYDPKDHGAVWALENKRGDCSEFTDLFVALCRANGIPARAWDGYLVTPTKAGGTPKHARAEVYLAEYGWVPFDALHTRQGGTAFDVLPPVYVYLDMRRNNAELNNHHYSKYTYQGGGVQLRSGFVVRRLAAVAGK